MELTACWICDLVDSRVDRASIPRSLRKHRRKPHPSLTNREVLVLSVDNDESNVALRLYLHLCVCCRAARAMTV